MGIQLKNSFRISFDTFVQGLLSNKFLGLIYSTTFANKLIQKFTKTQLDAALNCLCRVVSKPSSVTFF